MIADLDKQQSASNWLARRSGLLPKIMSWNNQTDMEELRTFAPQWMVIDTHAGLRRADRTYLLSRANCVMVPVNPSVFGIEATAKFLIELHADPNVRSGKVAIGLLGSRTDSRTRMAQELTRFFKRNGLQAVNFVPARVMYPQCARDGVSIYDLPASRTSQQIEAWVPLLNWMKGNLNSARGSGVAETPAEVAAQQGILQIA